MTITLAAVYAPIGLLTGITGVMFREFAFSLAGSVMISGVVALTLSPVMSSVLLTRDMDAGKFPHLVEMVYDRVTQAYGRVLDRVLDYRPAVMLFGAVILGSIFFLYSGSRSELAPPRTRAICSARSKGRNMPIWTMSTPMDGSSTIRSPKSPSLSASSISTASAARKTLASSCSTSNPGPNVAVLRPRS